VVRDVKRGRARLWKLDPLQIAEVKRTQEATGRGWDVALGKLKLFAESH